MKYLPTIFLAVFLFSCEQKGKEEECFHEKRAIEGCEQTAFSIRKQLRGCEYGLKEAIGDYINLKEENGKCMQNFDKVITIINDCSGSSDCIVKKLKELVME